MKNNLYKFQSPIVFETKLLKDKPECIPTLAHIWYETLGKIWMPDVDKEQVITNFSNHVNDISLPLTYVTFVDNSAVGMCSLRMNDGVRSDLYPWLGSLCVAANYQNQGIGKQLISHVQNQARRLGFECLYLFTLDRSIPQYYERLGWFVIGQDKYNNHPVQLMKYIL